MIEVGRKLYYKQNDKICETTVTKIALDEYHNGYKTVIQVRDMYNVYRYYYASDIGFRLFLTVEDAKNE